MAISSPSYEAYSFESSKPKDVYSALHCELLTSKAWKALTPRQHDLYTYCKLQYRAREPKPTLRDANGEAKSNPIWFTMNREKYVNKYELYSDNDRGAFYRDMAALIARGFIECVYSGKDQKAKSIYTYSDAWRMYGTAAFLPILSGLSCDMKKRVQAILDTR